MHHESTEHQPARGDAEVDREGREAGFAKEARKQYNSYSYSYSLPTYTLWMQVLVVDSHIQRIVLANKENTVTQQVSHRSIKC